MSVADRGERVGGDCEHDDGATGDLLGGSSRQRLAVGGVGDGCRVGSASRQAGSRLTPVDAELGGESQMFGELIAVHGRSASATASGSAEPAARE